VIRARATGRRWNAPGIVRVDPRYFRPSEVDALLGDASKARTRLGWSRVPASKSLVREMVDADFEPPSAIP